MKLIANWREELNKAWSVRIALLMSFLGVANEVLPALNGIMSPLAYAALSVVLVLARVTLTSNDPGKS